jgi:hypothetical protein
MITMFENKLMPVNWIVYAYAGQPNLLKPLPYFTWFETLRVMRNFSTLKREDLLDVFKLSIPYFM